MRGITLLLVLVLMVSACGGDDTATEPEAAEEPAAIEQPAEEAVEEPAEAIEEEEAEEPPEAAEEEAVEEEAEEPPEAAEEEAVEEEPAEAVEEEPVAEEDSAGVTLANFNKLETGMSYEEAVKLLGSEGEVLSETDMAGIKTVMYVWYGSGLGANMNVMFQNGELISKAQFGLQ